MPSFNGFRRPLEWWREHRSSKTLETLYLCHHVVGDQGGYTPVFQKVLPLDTVLGRPPRVKDLAESLPAHAWCIPGYPCLPIFSGSICLFPFTGLLLSPWPAKTPHASWPCRPPKKNIVELQEELNARFREQRQAAITSELLDIISGFEALSEEVEM